MQAPKEHFWDLPLLPSPLLCPVPTVSALPMPLRCAKGEQIPLSPRLFTGTTLLPITARVLTCATSSLGQFTPPQGTW